VLDVDLDRKRISLTMRMDDQPTEKTSGQRPTSNRANQAGKGNNQRRGGGGNGGGQRAGGQPQGGGGTFADLFAKAKEEKQKKDSKKRS